MNFLAIAIEFSLISELRFQPMGVQNLTEIDGFVFVIAGRGPKSCEKVNFIMACRLLARLYRGHEEVG